MKKGLAGFTLILIMFFNLIYMCDLGGFTTNPLTNESINKLRGNYLGNSDSTLQSEDNYISSKTSNIPVGWNYQKIINLNPSTPSVDYNVKVILDPSNFNYTQAKSDGSDIRFTDLSDNPLSYWIETWNQAGRSIIWVKILIMGTNSFYMNYGNPSAISESNGDATFVFFDDFSGTTIDSGKWWTETDTYSTMSVSGGIVSLSSDTPSDNAPSVHLGFSDFYVLHGQTYGAIAANGISLGRSYGPSNIFFIKNITNSGMDQIDNVYNYEEWYTTDIRWVSNSLAQFNNGSGIATHVNSTTFPTTPLQVRLLTMDMYGGSGTWFGQAIQSIGTWGAGHAIRARSWHDGVGAPEIKCDWIFVHKCVNQEPAVTVVYDDLLITSPETKNYPGPMKGHYPASFSFENDPSLPMDADATNPNLDIMGNPPVGWDAYYSAYYSFVRVIDEFLDHKKVVQFRGDSRASSAGLGIDLPSTTSGTVEFWFCKESDTGVDGTYFTLSDAGGSIGFTIEDGDLLHGNYPGTELASDVFPINTWMHIRIDFDIAQGWQIQLNNTWFGLGYTLPFTGTPSDISRFDVRSLDQSPPPSTVENDQELYLDSVGYSWDSSYQIGDNLEEGLLIDFIHPKKSVTNWEGYYPATMGFDEQLTGSMPINWFFQSKGGTNPNPNLITCSVLNSFTDQYDNNHTKVLGLSDHSTGGIGTIVGYLDRMVTSGTVEVWTLHDIISTSYGNSFGLAKGITNPYWTVQIKDEYGTLHYMDGNTSVNTGVTLTDNKWYRYSIDFSSDGSYAGLGTHEYRFRMYDSDGTTLLYTSPDTSFRFYGDTIAFRIATGESITCDLYYDAFGCSWDPNYNIGDNRFPTLYEGPELAELSWMGYSLDSQPNVTISGTTTIPMPLAGSHTIQLFGSDSGSNPYKSVLREFKVRTIYVDTPRSINYVQGNQGYYPGTFGFEEELHGTTGTALDFIDEYYAAGSFVGIGVQNGPFYGHKKVLHVADAQDSTETYGVHYFDNPPSAGTIEFHNLVDNVHMPSGTNYFQLRASDDTIAIQMRINVVGSELSNIEYYNGVSWQLIADQASYQWYHHSISFDCEAGVNGQFSWVISFENGTEVDRVENIEFLNDLDTLDEIYLASDVPTYFGATRWDAFGFSWEGYSVGDNLKEGLLISYATPTLFDWTGYSLDGQANVTIYGNHTIAMPAIGNHTIQVVGFDYLGNFYQSDVRSFEIILSNPPSISEPNDFIIPYGEVGYSIFWSVSDPNPYNYTIYRNSSVYQEGTWITTITCSLDGLEEGLHIFNCLIENIWGTQASDEVWVTILPDTTPPVISSPDDISFEEGSTGYSLTWSGSDQNPWWATVHRNESLIYDQAWTGNNIEISLDGLEGGAKYFYNCTLLDVAGNSVFDLVFVSVLKHVSDTTTLPTSTVTTASTTTTNQSSITPSITSISGLTALAMLIFLSLIRLQRDSVRKKKK